MHSQAYVTDFCYTSQKLHTSSNYLLHLGSYSPIILFIKITPKNIKKPIIKSNLVTIDVLVPKSGESVLINTRPNLN